MTEDRPGGWFVASVRELPRQENELGATGEFDKQRERFDEFGINLTVLRPGQNAISMSKRLSPPARPEGGRS